MTLLTTLIVVLRWLSIYISFIHLFSQNIRVSLCKKISLCSHVYCFHGKKLFRTKDIFSLFMCVWEGWWKHTATSIIIFHKKSFILFACVTVDNKITFIQNKIIHVPQQRQQRTKDTIDGSTLNEVKSVELIHCSRLLHKSKLSGKFKAI